MIDDEKTKRSFFERSDQGIQELDIKYGKLYHNPPHHIVEIRQDAEECVNDAYLGAWNANPPVRPNPLLAYLAKHVKYLWYISDASILHGAIQGTGGCSNN